MPPKPTLDMPEDNKSHGRQTGASKTPPKSAKTKSAEREARLAEALKANLRRRKAGTKADGDEGKAPDGQEEAPKEKVKDD